MCTGLHHDLIFTGPTVNKGFDIRDSQSKLVVTAIAVTTIGAEIETGGVAP
jgi:hypothetical protein